jgi:TPR repeat protein
VSDEFQIQVRPKDADSSLSLSTGQSGLVARGRRDAVALSNRSFKNYFEVLCWLAENGDAEAQFNLGCAYATGDVFLAAPKDYVSALHWFRNAAEQLHLAANLELGDIYQRGEVVPADHAESAHYYYRAADIAVACGPEEWDPDLVISAIQQGADRGHACAQSLLGAMYAVGAISETPQDYVEAVRWYRKAAEQGNAEAQFSLARAYFNGQGVPQDYVAAHMWSNLAAAQPTGVLQKQSSAFRNEAAAKMTPQQIAEAQRLARAWEPKPA